jgi:FkbM family methyltransferase
MGLVRHIAKKVLHRLPEPVFQAIRRCYYVRALRSAGEAGEADLEVIRYLIKSGDCVVDVGANIGVYTKHLSYLVGESGRVYAIEPFPSTFDLLHTNVRALALRNIELMSFAVSNENGRVTMEIPVVAGEENFYRARIVQDEPPADSQRVKVESRTLDVLFSGLPHPIALIKCDVEGHELDCVRGGMELVRRCHPAWLIEISGDPDGPTSTANAVFRMLLDESYEAFWFDGVNLNKRRKGDTSVNYFFLTLDHQDTLSGKGITLSR